MNEDVCEIVLYNSWTRRMHLGNNVIPASLDLQSGL